MAWPSSAESARSAARLRGRCSAGHQRRVGGGRAAGGQQRHDLAELQRRVGARRQVQFVQRAGNIQRDIDAARLGLQIDIQNRLHVQRVEERDRSLADACTGAEEDHLAMRDVDAAQQRRIADGAAQPQVGLQPARPGSASFAPGYRARCRSGHRSSGRPASRCAPTGVRTGSADCAISELKSDCGLKPVRRMVMVPDSMLRSRGAGEIQVGVGHRADAFGIAHAHLLARWRAGERQWAAAAVCGEAGELDLAAAGFAAEALDGGAVAAEQR